MLKFSELLREYLQTAGISVSQLSRQSGLPRRTIANWLEGYAQKPRDWCDVITIATALHLDRLATNDLLVSAGFPVLATLRTHHPDHIALRVWNEADPAGAVGAHIVTIIGESNGSLFQGLPFAKAVYLMEQTVQLAEQLNDRRYLCHLTLELAHCLIVLGRYPDAIAALHKVIALAERSQDREMALDARALLLRVHVYAQSDRAEIDAQRRHLQTAIRPTLSNLPLALQSGILYSLGLWAGSVQNFDEAAHYYQRLFQSAPGIPYQLTALNNLGDLALQQQDYRQAYLFLNQAIALTENTPMQRTLSYVHANLGVVHLRCGDYDAALSQFETGLTIATAAEDQHLIFFVRLHRSELALRQHDYALADIEFRHLLALCTEAPFSASKSLVEYCLDRLEKGQGHYLLDDPCYREMLE